MFYRIKKIVPTSIKRTYHRLLADLANAWYRSPSERMIVIGVTGTSGKSTTVHLIAQMLSHAGFRVGVASTIYFKVDQREWINDKKMTMVGRFQLQKLLAQMAAANCQYAIVETTSEGIVQSRHRHIAYDILVCTNLYPEHIESHGSFENYKNAKLTLFKELIEQPRKTFAGTSIPKTSIVNLDFEQAGEFLANDADKKIGFTLSDTQPDGTDLASILRATSIVEQKTGVTFSVDGQSMQLRLLGRHNVGNALAAIAVGQTQGLSMSAVASGLSSIAAVPGRQEFIRCGQPFEVIVDYAFEQVAMNKLYDVVRQLGAKRSIHILGGTGGGRDRSRRAEIGRLAATHSQAVIVTNEDPYDEKPEDIMADVAGGANEIKKFPKPRVYEIVDRREAIAKGLSLAKEGDVVLITGKGSEQAIVGARNTKTPWDDRRVVREELAKLGWSG